MFRIESLLSAQELRLPKAGGRQDLLHQQPQRALQPLPHELRGKRARAAAPAAHSPIQPQADQAASSSQVFPGLGKILVMIDKDGDEAFQPMLIPMDGGFPEPAFGGQLEGNQV